MKEVIKNPRKGCMPITIWHRQARDLIPERFRQLLTIVLPIDYVLLMFFGFTAIIIPVPAFQSIVGEQYGSLWALVLGVTSLVSLIGLVFRKKFELYAAIAVSFVVGIYPFFIYYLILFEPSEINYQRSALIFSSMIFPMLPTWRAVDIAMHIRQSKQRELYVTSLIEGYRELDDK